MNSYLTEDTDALQVFSTALPRVSVHGSVLRTTLSSQKLNQATWSRAALARNYVLYLPYGMLSPRVLGIAPGPF
jgi:hypothetical protein